MPGIMISSRITSGFISRAFFKTFRRHIGNHDLMAGIGEIGIDYFRNLRFVVNHQDSSLGDLYLR